MKRVALLLFLAGWLVPLASAQDHFQVGAYGDYFRLSQTNTNLAGLGARVGYKAFSHVMLEGEMSYDFNQAFTDHCLATGCTVTVANSNIKVLHGLFGAKIIGGHGAFRPFLTLKGGFVNFRLDPRPAIGYRRIVRSAGKSRISDGTACKSAVRAFSGASRLFDALQGSAQARSSGFPARHGNPRRNFFPLCQTTDARALRRLRTARRPPAPASKTTGFSQRWVRQ